MKYISYTPFDDQMLFYFIYILFIYIFILFIYIFVNTVNLAIQHQSLFTAIELYYSSKYPLPATTKYTLVISPSIK